jgi:hypothetical protein
MSSAAAAPTPAYTPSSRTIWLRHTPPWPPSHRQPSTCRPPAGRREPGHEHHTRDRAPAAAGLPGHRRRGHGHGRGTVHPHRGGLRAGAGWAAVPDRGVRLLAASRPGQRGPGPRGRVHRPGRLPDRPDGAEGRRQPLPHPHHRGTAPRRHNRLPLHPPSRMPRLRQRRVARCHRARRLPVAAPPAPDLAARPPGERP